MRDLLEFKYEELFEKYDINKPLKSENINTIIKSALKKFISENSKVAIYCNGGHTRMLMSDFMFELKNVKYIVDNYSSEQSNAGFILINDDDLEKEHIDGVIISSFKHKDKIIEEMNDRHPQINILNIYSELTANGIDIQTDYYYHNHPYQHYHSINTLQRKISETTGKAELNKLYVELVTHYIHIKDFYNAIKVIKKAIELFNKEKYRNLLVDLEEIYELEKLASSRISEKNVLLFCMDGLRRRDLDLSYMPKLYKLLRTTGIVFDNAYSYSTSTFESLIPVYSENSDLRTKYYNDNCVTADKCRFIKTAKNQGRKIYFYTDAEHYVDSEDISYSASCQTVTEKLWNFILDAVDEENGFYYIHELYESHFTFSNPYTKDKLISEGTAMLFDFLPQKGGRLRTDYERQHLDALYYLDDVVTPLVEKMSCCMLIYADHGNLILENETKLEDINDMQLTCGEEWLQIPLIIRMPKVEPKTSNKLISLMSLNDIVVCMLNGRVYEALECEYIKCGRSEIYNLDFRYLYKQIGKERCLYAFETFIFGEGYKLVIYSDGFTELYVLPLEEKISDSELKKHLIKRIREKITVCSAIIGD